MTIEGGISVTAQIELSVTLLLQGTTRVVWGQNGLQHCQQPSQRFFGSFHSMGAPASVRHTQLQLVVSMRLALDI